MSKLVSYHSTSAPSVELYDWVSEVPANNHVVTPMCEVIFKDRPGVNTNLLECESHAGMSYFSLKDQDIVRLYRPDPGYRIIYMRNLTPGDIVHETGFEPNTLVPNYGKIKSITRTIGKQNQLSVQFDGMASFLSFQWNAMALVTRKVAVPTFRTTNTLTNGYLGTPTAVWQMPPTAGTLTKPIAYGGKISTVSQASSHYPHTCYTCGSPAYHSSFSTDCSNKDCKR